MRMDFEKRHDIGHSQAMHIYTPLNNTKQYLCLPINQAISPPYLRQGDENSLVSPLDPSRLSETHGAFAYHFAIPIPPANHRCRRNSTHRSGQSPLAEILV